MERARQAIRRKDATAATAEVAALRELSPGHVAIGELTRGINSLIEGLDRTARLANAERTGVKLFLSGQYKQAADILEQAVNQSLTSPRVHLFLASSRGAQALLAPQDQRPALVDAARKHYALAKPGAGTLAADERFISPSILQLLRAADDGRALIARASLGQNLEGRETASRPSSERGVASRSAAPPTPRTSSPSRSDRIRRRTETSRTRCRRRTV